MLILCFSPWKIGLCTKAKIYWIWTWVICEKQWDHYVLLKRTHWKQNSNRHFINVTESNLPIFEPTFKIMHVVIVLQMSSPGVSLGLGKAVAPTSGFSLRTHQCTKAEMLPGMSSKGRVTPALRAHPLPKDLCASITSVFGWIPKEIKKK